MDRIIPRKELAEAIDPFYPKPKGAGRGLIGIERMLHIHFLQHGSISRIRPPRRLCTTP